MPALRAVEPHRLVEHGEQTGVIPRVLRIIHGLQQIGFGLGRAFVPLEDRVQPLEEGLGVKRGGGGAGIHIVRIGRFV